MADVSVVSQFIARQVAAALYPAGSDQESRAGVAVKVYPGWPVSEILQKDIDAGNAHVSVWPLPSERQASTGLGRPSRTIEKPEPSLKVSIYHNFINLSGEVLHDTDVQIGIDDTIYRFFVPAGSTLERVKEMMLEKLPSSLGALDYVYFLRVGHLTASVNTCGMAMRELRRQIKEFQITVWAATPALRNRIGALVDDALSGQHHIDLGDFAPAQMLYARQFESDRADNWHVYRRDLIFTVNFATTQTFTAHEVMQTIVTVNGQQALS